MTLHDLDLVRMTDLPDELTHSKPNVPSQNRLAVLWDEHEVVVALVSGMRPMTVCLHCIPKYRKPPEGSA